MAALRNTFRTATSVHRALLSRPAVQLHGARLASTSVAPSVQAPQHVPTAQEYENDPQLAGLSYPQLPNVSRQLRPAKKGWWDEQERINFGEVVPENDEVLSMWAPDVHKKNPYEALAQLALASGVLAAFASLIYLTQPALPAAKREYPYDGLVKELSGTDDQTYAAVQKGSAVSSEDDEDEE